MSEDERSAGERYDLTNAERREQQAAFATVLRTHLFAPAVLRGALLERDRVCVVLCLSCLAAVEQLPALEVESIPKDR